VDAYGTVDELNSVIGWTVTQLADAEVRDRLGRLQHDLFTLGSELATPPATEGRNRPRIPELPRGRVEEMETWIDEADEELPALESFILPGGEPGAAALHVARTVARRAERSLLPLRRQNEVHDDVLRYLNRLSDLLFTWARLENHRAGAADVAWEKPTG